MKLTWNLVTKNLHGHEMLRKKLYEKITKLEKHLKRFPPDAVHLHIALEGHPKKDEYTAALTLRVPSDILHSRKSADDIIKAFDDAVKALLRTLTALKADLRRESLWKRKARRNKLHGLKNEGFSPEPQPEGTGPKKYGDVVRDLFQQHYPELLRHIRRHIHQNELANDIPRNSLDARDTLDEVARRVIAKVAQRPKGTSWVIWFYHLIHKELKRQYRILNRKKARHISIDQARTLSDDAERAEGNDAEKPLHIVKQEREPPVLRPEVPPPGSLTAPPGQIAAEKDIVEQLYQGGRNTPKLERQVFELYYIEGLEPEEIAMVTGQPLQRVRDYVASAQQRLRGKILAQEAA
ncbi:MAG TPA: sigma-70 family RNA polymerase sigma factor [Verrucomicrobiae bacterium]|jgi:ribosomal subunit interface protein|nr:sigma-70 family RNA polymerase sigma factor [Verrucomicrobiae bacterium]